MKRSHFIKTAAAASLAIGSLTSLTNSNKKSVTILHTNDTHSRIDPFPADDKNYPNCGGIVQRLNMIQKIRRETEHVLLLDAGDIFQGTPYFNLYRGEVELKAMSAMSYDAATMGNHDFDAGLDGFEKVLRLANFPFLCANYDFTNTPLAGKTEPYHVFVKDQFRIGVFGIGVNLKGLVAAKLYGETQYLDPIAKAQEQADFLRENEKCHLVICLSHLGFTPKLNPMCDKVLASSTHGIDCIIGGHTHTFMQKPENFKNLKGESVIVNQVGWAGLVLGRLDFFFDEDSNVNDQTYFSYGENIPIS